MKNIITVQHTQSLHHTNGMVGSWTNWPLTEKGKADAARIAEKLAWELRGKTPVLYSSDLLRARQTAEPIWTALDVLPIFTPALRERNFGSACGKPVAYLREFGATETDVDSKMFPDAESRRDEWERLLPFFKMIEECENDSIVIVSHGDLLSVFNAMFLGLPVESLESFELFGSAGGVSHLQMTDSGKRFIRKLSDLSYCI